MPFSVCTNKKQTHFCTVLLSQSLPEASLSIFPITSTSHHLTMTSHCLFQDGSYRVRVFLNLVAYEIEIIILLVVQNFFLVLSLVV